MPPRGPRFRPQRLGPWPFTISVVNLFGGNFVWFLWLAHPVRSVFAATPLADSTPSDHDSPNAPATARSVYVFAHTAAQPARLASRFWVGLWPPVIVICATKTQPPAAALSGDCCDEWLSSRCGGRCWNPRLGPRPFTISVVKLFGGNFV